MSLAARLLRLIDRLDAPRAVHAHCDIPCGIYDPELARIEAESALKAIQKYHDSDDEVFRQRCVMIKEQRTDIAKHHLSVLWSDYFKPPHLEEFPELHGLAWQVLKQCTKVKASVDAADAEELLSMIDEIDDIFQKTGGLDSARVKPRR
ncbi:MAG TPA: superoxide dismutase, Ni [Egibacteraceae bacterium]|jgi:nickel superoxide dismutase|nr:superoxide dismutase, Ni [Egibacteraceae bacterium]